MARLDRMGLGGDVVENESGWTARAGGQVRARHGGRSGAVVPVMVAVLVVAGWLAAQLVLAVPAGAVGAGGPSAVQWSEVAVPRVDGRTADFVSVSCVPAGWCVAVGRLAGTTDVPVAVIDAGGRHDATGTGLLPAGTTSGRLTSVSCAPQGNCVAVGWASAPSGTPSAFAIVVTRGGFGTPAAVPGMSGSAHRGDEPAISCPTPAWCLVLGPSPSGLVAMTGVPGAWQAGSLPPGTHSADSVDCLHQDQCIVGVGARSSRVGVESLAFAQLTGQIWRATVEHLVVPRHTSWRLTGLACRAMDRCEVAVTGTGAFPGGAVAGVMLLEADLSGHSGSPRHRPPVATATPTGYPYSSTSGPFGPFALACPPGGGCQTVGSGAGAGGVAAHLTASGWVPVAVVGPGTRSPAGLDALWCGNGRAVPVAGGPPGTGRRGPHVPPRSPAPSGAKAGGCVAAGHGVIATLVAVPATEMPTGAAGGLLLAVGIGAVGGLGFVMRTRRRPAVRIAAR